MLAQANAVLVKVSSGGLTEEPGSARPAGAGGDKFDGSVSAYYREKQERTVVAGDRVVEIRRIVVVDTRDPAIEWEVDDAIELELDDGTAIAGAIQTIEVSKLSAAAGSGVETTRLELEPK